MAQIGKTITKFQSPGADVSPWDQMESSAQLFHQASQICVTETRQYDSDF